ncbi:MAG: hypothetical protein SPK09_04755 [Porphyromonas sp.]|nr:hypothetical protein [Porphyromonas sp.]
MNKILRFTALGLCAVALLGSCKKKGTEPIPTPQPGTEQPGQNPGSGNTGAGNNPGTTPGTDTPVDNTKGIKLVLAEGQTDISITALIGNEITLEGTTTDGAFASFKPANANEVKTLKASAPGATIVIKGNVSNLYISKGNFKLLDLSQAPATLASLTSTGAKLAGVDLSGAVNLTSLTLSDYAPLKSLDLSKMSKLESVVLGRYGETDKQRSLSNVVWPNQNAIKVLRLYEVGLTTLPVASFAAIETLYLRGSAFGAFDHDFTFRNSKIKKFTLFKVKHAKSLYLENNEGLTSVVFTGRRRDAGAETEVVVKGNANLASVDLSTDDLSLGIKKIDLSNNPKLTTLTIGSTSLFKSAGLLSVDLSGTGLEEKAILAVIEQLVEGDNSTRKIKLTNPTQTVKDAVQTKKWVLQ